MRNVNKYASLLVEIGQTWKPGSGVMLFKVNNLRTCLLSAFTTESEFSLG